MKKFFKLLFSLLLLIPLSFIITACGGDGGSNGDGSSNGGSNGDGSQPAKTYVISFYEYIVWSWEDENPDPLYTMTATEGVAVTFPTTEQLLASGKAEYHDDTYYVEEWNIVTPNGNIVIDESYFNHYHGGDIKVYAGSWAKKEVTLTYNLDGGENHPDNPTKTNSLYNIKAPTKIGFKFLGWTYTDDTYNNPDDEPRQNIYYEIKHGATLTAHWEQNTINFLGNSETSGSMQPVHFIAGEPLALPTNGFEKEGSEFVGWCKDRYGKTQIYTENFLFEEDLGEISLWAVWETGLILMEQTGNYDYENQIYNDESYTVMGVKEGYPNAYIPEEINGCIITDIWIDRQNPELLETLTFENDGLLKNGRTFNSIYVSDCPNLVSLQVPKCVTRVNFCSRNPKLTEIIYHENVKEISILGNGLEELIVPQGVESVYLWDMENLKTIFLPSSVTEYRISGIDNIEELTVPFICLPGTSFDNLQNFVQVDGDTYEEQCAHIKKLIITDANVSTHEKPFEYYAHLEEIVFTNATQFPNKFFYNVPDLKKVTLSTETTSIGENAFNQCPKLVEVQMGNKVETIGKETFVDCVELVRINSNEDKVILPTALKVLPNAMFKGCLKISYIDYTVNENTSIPESFAQNCTSLTSFTIKNGIELISKRAFENTGLTNIVGEENVLYISEYAFAKTKLTSVSLDSLTDIYYPEGAFSECSLLSTVTLNPEKKSISPNMFAFCSSLTDISAFKNTETIGASAFFATGITELELWPSLKTVNYNSFSNCENLQTVDISKATQVTTLSSNFKNCPKLKYFYIPSHIENMEGTMFEGSGLEEIDCADNLTATFISCKFAKLYKLKKVDLQNSSISSDGFFKDCPSLEDVNASIGNASYFGATEECLALYPEAFEQIATDKKGTTFAWVPKSIKNLKISGLSEIPFVHSNVEHIVYGLQFIADNALKGSPKLKTVIAQNLQRVGESSFEGCVSLETLTTATGTITTVGVKAFKDCGKLTAIDLSMASEVNEYAFENCTSLQSVNLSNVSTLGKYAFHNNASLSSLVLSQSQYLREIPEYAFTNHKLTSLHITNNITTVGKYAFSGGTELTSITFDEDCTATFGDSVFSGATKMESIYIPSSINTIYGCLLEGMPNLKFASFSLEGRTINKTVWDKIFGGVPQNLETLEVRDGTSDVNFTDNEYIKQIRFINYGLLGQYDLQTSYAVIDNLPNLESVYIEGNLLYVSSADISGLEGKTVILGDATTYNAYKTNGYLSALVAVAGDVEVVKSVVDEAVAGSTENAYLTITDNANFTVTNDENYYYFTKNVA